MEFLGVEITKKPQHDGASWREYQTPSGIVLTVNQAFHDLIHEGNHNVLNEDNKTAKRLLRLLHKYRGAVTDKYYDDIRQFMIKWWEAEFCALWDTNLGIREVTDAWTEQKRNTRNKAKMVRMDIIAHLLDLGALPRWINTPIHYAMLNIPKKDEEPSHNFILMEKVDHGVTVVDILNKKDREERGNFMEQHIVEEFGEFYGFTGLEWDPAYATFQEEVRGKYEELVIRLKSAFLEQKTDLPEGLKFEDVFADLFERNILITYNNAPIGGSRVTFWIIDQ